MPTKKQLQEENEKLKEKLEFVKKVKEDYFINIKDKNNDIEILEEEIKKLKEKHTHDLEHDDKVYNTIIKRLQEENEEIEKLKEENEKLKKQLQEENNVFAEEKTNMCVLLTQTIRENEKLKEENDNMKKGYDCVSSQMDYEEEEMKKCMEEFPEVSDEDCMGCRFARFRNFTDCMRIGQRDRIKELQEENEELKKQIPDKKGKKLSQKDKEVLKGIIESIEIGQGSSTDQEYNLLNRLLK